MMQLTITVNGESWDLDVAPADVLLDVLREQTGVKSPKIGCERGDCGSCTVLLDGRTVRSCLVLAVEVEGHEITTRLYGPTGCGAASVRTSLCRVRARALRRRAAVDPRPRAADSRAA